MGREWVKLHTCILDDADINGLSPETGWLWTRMIALSGRNEENGRIGTPRNVAYVLHEHEAAINSAVAELDGRVYMGDDGALWFRDWKDWQSQSERERQRTSRANKQAVADAEATEDVTTCHDTSQAVTDGHVYRGDKNNNISAATAPDPAPATAAGPGPDAYRAVYGRFPRRAQYAALNAACDRLGIERVRAAIQSWAEHGWSPVNVAGMVEVAENGITQRQPPGAGKWRLGDPVPDGWTVVLSEHGHYLERATATHD